VPDVCGALTVLCATTGNLLTHLAETGLVLPSGYFWLACRDAYHRGVPTAGPPTCLWCVADRKPHR